jgi:predicted kinase
MIMHGLAASGKSTRALQLVDKTGAICLRSDAERKRLAGLTLHAKTNSGLYQDLYDPKVTQQTYAYLTSLAENIINAGYSVIVDAAFLQKEQRALFSALAKRLQVPFFIEVCQVDNDELEKRLLARQQQTQEISEADLAVLQAQQAVLEPLTKEELANVKKGNSSGCLEISENSQV